MKWYCITFDRDGNPQMATEWPSYATARAQAVICGLFWAEFRPVVTTMRPRPDLLGD